MTLLSQRTLRSIVLLLTTGVLTPCVLAQENLQARIDSLVQPYLDNKVTEGLVIGTIQQGKASSFGFGRVSDKSERTPDGNTIYEIGSISKVFTGILLADAVTQQRVKLDQPAAELLPANVKMPAGPNRPITLQDLATHVSGLPRLPNPFSPADWGNPYADYSKEKLYAFLNNYQLTRAPGEKHEYSNLGMGLLGQLLADNAKSTYQRLLVGRITKPLKMRSTSINLNKQLLRRVAPPHFNDGQPAAQWDFDSLAGAGGIRSSVNDMLLFAQANLAPPTNELGQAIDLAWKIHQQPLTSADNPMGLGWLGLRSSDARGHSGQTGGYYSMIQVNRDNQTAVVLLTNRSAPDTEMLAQDIMRLLAGKEVTPRAFPKSIEVAAAVMQRYVGKYELGPGQVFTVSIIEGSLMVQLTGQQALEVNARSETEWYPNGIEATITFQMSGDGKCTALELFQGGVKQKANRIE